AFQDQLPRGVVENLSGNRIEMKPSPEPANGPELDRQEIEEEGALAFRRQRDQLSLRARARLVVDELDVRGLTAQAGAVVHDLAVDLARGVVDERHGWVLS